MSASAILKLQAAGFSAEQVTALAELIDTQAATKTDLEGTEHRLESKIAGTKTELEGVEHRLESKIAATKTELEGVEHRLELKIEGVEHRLELNIAAIKTDIEAIEHRLELKIGKVEADGFLLKWMLGFVLAFQVAIFAKLFVR